MSTIKAAPHTRKSTHMSRHKRARSDWTLALPRTHTGSGLSAGCCLWACGLWTASQTPVCPNSLWAVQLSACPNHCNSNTYTKRRTHAQPKNRQTDKHEHCSTLTHTNTHTAGNTPQITATWLRAKVLGKKVLASTWTQHSTFSPKVQIGN